MYANTRPMGNKIELIQILETAPVVVAYIVSTASTLCLNNYIKLLILYTMFAVFQSTSNIQIYSQMYHLE